MFWQLFSVSYCYLTKLLNLLKHKKKVIKKLAYSKTFSYLCNTEIKKVRVKS